MYICIIIRNKFNTMKTAKIKKRNPTEEAFFFLAPKNPLLAYWPDSKYIEQLTSYKKNKGAEALQSLAGFYVWTVGNLPKEEQERALTSTFAHDLGQQNDKWMHPRSSSYLKFWKEQQAKKK